MDKTSPREIRARDWFAVGQIFGPYYFDNPKSSDPCAQNFGVSVGIQTLAAMDVATQKILQVEALPRVPGALMADELLRFLKKIFDKQGKPKIGVLFSGSVWMSSQEMLFDPNVAARAEYLQKVDIQLGPMADGEKSKLVENLTIRKMRVVFDEEAIYS
jgi:hypothetical protein